MSKNPNQAFLLCYPGKRGQKGCPGKLDVTGVPLSKTADVKCPSCGGPTTVLMPYLLADVFNVPAKEGGS